jgi:hypothetical protein
MITLTGTATLVIDGVTVTAPVTLPVDVNQLAAAIASLGTPPVVTPPVVTPPVVTPPAAGTFWVYHVGKFSWPGDYSFQATANYADTVGKPGGTCIAVHITGQWGGWQPFAFLPGGAPFDTSPYKYLIFSAKPTVPNQSHGMGFDANNDVADGSPIAFVAGGGVTKYGPIPQVGVWGQYKIPLADFKLGNPSILKFSLTDGTGNPTNLFYVDDVGFTTA